MVPLGPPRQYDTLRLLVVFETLHKGSGPTAFEGL